MHCVLHWFLCVHISTRRVYCQAYFLYVVDNVYFNVLYSIINKGGLFMNERLKKLRTRLGLNQSDFGKKIGVTKSAICNYENGSRALQEHTILSICREYNVDYLWFTTGEGGDDVVFTDLPKTILDELSIQYDLTNSEKNLISTFLSMTKNERAVLIKFLQQK